MNSNHPIYGDYMDIPREELVLLYLYEKNSFDLIKEDEVPHQITIEAASLQCGIKRDDLENIVGSHKDLIKIDKKNIMGLKKKNFCLFLTPKGVKKAKEIQSNLMEKRMDYIDDKGIRNNKRISRC